MPSHFNYTHDQGYGNPSQNTLRQESMDSCKHYLPIPKMSLYLRCYCMSVCCTGNAIMPLPPVDLLDSKKLSNLINMPWGCGEQLMMTFAPLVYAMNYLSQSGLLNKHPDLKQRGLHFMQEGESCYFALSHLFWQLFVFQR